MKIHRYIGNTTYEAMYKMKRELGDNAVILHTRKIRKPGFLGIFRRPLIEVVAAIEQDNKIQSSNIPSKNIKNINFKNEPNVNLFNKYEGQDEDLSSEIKKIRSLMEDVIKKVDDKPAEKLPTQLIYYKNTLINNGVEETIASEILNEIKEQFNFYNKDTDTIRRIVLSNLNAVFGEPSPISLEGKQKVVFFVGPTGVGKTTTLAKIAASYALQDRNKVALITADTYRIAAVEQLKTYSEILGIPIKIIYETKEIYDALSNLREKELILIDTAGRNHKDYEQIKEVKELINSVNNKEVYLVLSSTTSWNTIKSTLKQYDIIDDYKLVFTKLDETDNLGVILNAKYHTKRPLSYFTTGQNVPEDIEIADISKLTSQLIGEV